MNESIKTVSTSATHLAMLVDDGNELGFGQIVMRDLIATDTELRSGFNS